MNVVNQERDRGTSHDDIPSILKQLSAQGAFVDSDNILPALLQPSEAVTANTERDLATIIALKAQVQSLQAVIADRELQLRDERGENKRLRDELMEARIELEVLKRQIGKDSE